MKSRVPLVVIAPEVRVPDNVTAPVELFISRRVVGEASESFTV